MKNFEVVQEYARLMQGFDFPEKRAIELASEIEQLREEIVRARDVLAFDDEPSAFATLLEKRSK